VRLLPEIVGAGIAGSFYGWTVSEVTTLIPISPILLFLVPQVPKEFGRGWPMLRV